MTRRQLDLAEKAFRQYFSPARSILMRRDGGDQDVLGRHVQSVVDRHRTPQAPVKPVRLCIHGISEFRVCMSCPPFRRMWQGGKP